MNKQTDLNFQKLLPLAAFMLVCGFAQAVQPPRVMFVSGGELQPVLINAAGKELPVKKGTIIPPGFSVKVPAGATVQIQTEEKAILAVRPNTLLKLEALGDGTRPNRYKLDNGGLRVANPDKKPGKFEVDTPNAKVRFDKGDHEAYYFKDANKFTDGKWGTFVRGFKDESVLSTKDGDTRIDSTKVGYVDGKSGVSELLDRPRLANTPLSDPITAPGKPITTMRGNQEVLTESLKQNSELPPITGRPIGPEVFKNPSDPLKSLPRAPLDPPPLVLAPKPIDPFVRPVLAVKPQIVVDQVTKTPYYFDNDRVSELGKTQTATVNKTIKTSELGTSTKVIVPERVKIQVIPKTVR